jgi:hypothetical protein
LVGTGLYDAHPRSYVRVHRIAWTGAVDLFLNAELMLAFADGQRKLHTFSERGLCASAPPPTDPWLALMQHEGP